MAYAFVQDVAATWELYRRVTAPTLEPLPEGLVLHVAGPTDAGFRVISVWTNEHAWRRFHDERLAPAIAALGGPAPPETTFRELKAGHVLVGGVGGRDPAGPLRSRR